MFESRLKSFCSRRENSLRGRYFIKFEVSSQQSSWNRSARKFGKKLKFEEKSLRVRKKFEKFRVKVWARGKVFTHERLGKSSKFVWKKVCECEFLCGWKVFTPTKFLRTNYPSEPSGKMKSLSGNKFIGFDQIFPRLDEILWSLAPEEIYWTRRNNRLRLHENFKLCAGKLFFSDESSKFQNLINTSSIKFRQPTFSNFGQIVSPRVNFCERVKSWRPR